MPKFTKEEKMNAVHRRLNNGESFASIATSIGAGRSTVRDWITNYESLGEAAFIRTKNRHYSLEEKIEIVEYYLSNKISLKDTCKRYGIKTSYVLRNWIKLYNGFKLKASPVGGKSKVMTKGRKTTFEERISIIEDHIRTGSTYDETASKYQVSYHQVYTWVHKYNELGIDGLKDGRGRTKPTEEMSELEKMKAENRMLKAKLEAKELEVAFIKKLKEIERRRF